MTETIKPGSRVHVVGDLLAVNAADSDFIGREGLTVGTDADGDVTVTFEGDPNHYRFAPNELQILDMAADAPRVGDTVTIRLADPKAVWERALNGRTGRVSHVGLPLSDYSHPISVDLDGEGGSVKFRADEVEIAAASAVEADCSHGYRLTDSCPCCD